MDAALHKWIHRAWYGESRSYILLLPLSGLYWLAITVRRWLYRLGVFRTGQLAVPVIVVGNITAGGTGKTPVTAWLSSELRQRGFRPGIVSRGYGGSGSKGTVRVDEASDPAIVGDEPVLLARRTECPVAIGSDRVQAAQLLIESGADVIVADDGLQHLALARDYEICVLDGERCLGNRMLLPAGPLRELPSRLARVDQVLINGTPSGCDGPGFPHNAVEFSLQPSAARRIDGSLERPLDAFAGQTVHAVAGIGNPGRFFAMLRSFGLTIVEHAFPDHAAISLRDLAFGDGAEVLMTEKDAVKLGQCDGEAYWYVPVTLRMSKALARPWLAQIESRLRNREVAS